MKRFVSQIIGNVAGLWLASNYLNGVQISVIPGESSFFVALTADWQLILVLGVVLALLNFFLKPILEILTLPLQFITLGLMGLVISAGMIWFLDFLFAGFTITGLLPLLWISLIIGGVNFIISKIFT